MIPRFALPVNNPLLTGIGPYEKSRPVQHTAQADCDSKESAFLDRFVGALIGAGAAADADIGIDYVLVFALRDGLDRALLSTGAALYASISNIVSHVITSILFFKRIP